MKKYTVVKVDIETARRLKMLALADDSTLQAKVNDILARAITGAADGITPVPLLAGPGIRMRYVVDHLCEDGDLSRPNPSMGAVLNGMRAWVSMLERELYPGTRGADRTG